MSKELVAVLWALLVVLGLTVGEIPAAGNDPGDPPPAEMGPAIEPGG